MKTDIQIAQEAKMEHIRDVVARAGIMEDELEFDDEISLDDEIPMTTEEEEPVVQE